MAKAKKKKTLNRVRLVTPVGRIVYPYISRLDEGRVNSTNKYKVDILIPKSEWKEKGKELREAVLAVGRDYIDDDTATLSDFDNPFKDGDAKEQDFFKGMVVMTVKSQNKPMVVGPDKKEYTDEEIEKIKGGDYARLVVSVYGYEQGPGVTLGLEVVQFVRPGAALGGGRAASVAMLDELDIEPDDLDLDSSDDDDEEEEKPKKAAKPAKAAKKAKVATVDVDDEEEDAVVVDAEEDEDEEEEEETPKKTRKPRGKAKSKSDPEDEDEDSDDDDDIL